MKKILLSLFAAIALNASAQTPTFESVQKFSCDNNLKIIHSTTDNAGNVYIGGYYIGTADFDPSATTNAQTAADYNSFIQKQTATGTILWTKFGTDINGLVNHFDVDPSGNVYLLGYFTNIYDANFGSGTSNLTSNGGSDYFVSKLNSQGDFVWATSGGGANSEIGEQIVVNQDGEAYIAIIETTTDPFAGSGSNSKDLKISKLNSSGSQIWASNFANYTGDFTYVNLELDQNNNPITSGRLRGFKDFDPTNGENILGSGSAYTWDEFLVKLVNATGAVSWANILNGTSNSLVSKKLAVDNQGNSYTYGRLSTGQVDFDASSNVANSVGTSASSGFIHKTTATGQHAWTITLNGYADYGHIESDNQGNIYLLNDATRNLSKYDNSGNNLWDFPYAATNAVDFEASSFNIDDLGSIYITGNGQATNSNHDTLSFNGTNLNGQITFTNVTNNTSEGFWVKFSQCIVNNATTISGSTLTATQSGATYQWVDCNSANAAIAGANAQTFTPTASGSYAVIITNGSCSDTSECQSVTISSIGIKEQTVSNFNIFPNPANDLVTLNNLPLGASIQITDMTGKTVLETSVLTEEMTIDLNGLMEGVYFVQILDNASIIGTKKLAISK